MTGNVQEWTVDAEDDRRGMRGGSWLSQPSDARTSFRPRFPRAYRDALIGFRCAR